MRKTTQEVLPAERRPVESGEYNLYPGFPVGAGKIWRGFEELARAILEGVGARKNDDGNGERAGGEDGGAGARTDSHTRTNGMVIIDGYPGVLWEHFRRGLEEALEGLGIQASWQDVGRAMRPAQEIEALAAPYLGGDDPLFGYRFEGELGDFFDRAKLEALRPEPGKELNILYGTGAALAGWEGRLLYVDVPKNEIQFRFRAGSATNIGVGEALGPKEAYKRAYFVDWVAANRHKARLLAEIDLWVDEQRVEAPAVMQGEDLREGLRRMAGNYFRVRPWFEPGPWGGQWIKEKIPGLPQEAANYAWSFELIVPENGLLFESDGQLLEASFDCLMSQESEQVLGEAAERFGTEFPIRFDFLDTFDGGNLSIQCHPRTEYIREHFGENFTQDETYYILDCEAGARVYLGFQENINPVEFRAALEESQANGTVLDIDRFVYSVPAHKHDLLLIPNGTIHGSGAGNLVLEISATPYIFTFKMYDWLRMDLDGKPRPLNIGRAFENLYFERKGVRIEEEFVSKQTVVRQGADWRVVHCPTHREHFYDVERYEFSGTVEIETDGSVNVLSLVEGRTVTLETVEGMRQRFSYAETFVVPAGAMRYRLISEGGEAINVVKCFIK